MVDKCQIEVSDEPQERWKEFAQLLRILKLGTKRFAGSQLDMLGQVDNYVKLVETLLIYRVQAVVDQLA